MSLIEVLAEYSAEGYRASMWSVDGGRLHCSVCDQETAAIDAAYEGLSRLEGTSDPDDEMAVVALTCPHCGSKATAVLHYGPTADAAEAEVLRGLTDERPS